jgi:phage/plasmid-associated DNA primase
MASKLYGEYTAWCERSGERYPMSWTAFGRKMAKRGFAKNHTNSGARYDGIGLQA